MNKTEQSINKLPSLYLFGVIAYFTLNALTQYWVSPTADLDQSEQLILSQDWQFGYLAQPPLYTWLVHGIFNLTGPSLASLLAVRVLLLSLLVILLYAAGRQFSFTRQQSLVTIVSIAFIPQLIWESQRDLTHSVLATVMAAATLLQTIKTQRNRVSSNYLILGLFFAMGLLSKYNYALFLLSLISTILLHRPYRQIVLNYRIVISAAIALAIIAPHVFWLFDHIGLATGSLYKLKAEGGNALAGIGHASLSALAFLTPLWMLALIVVNAKFQTSNEDQRNDSEFVTSLFGVTLAVVVLFVLVTGAQAIKDRWYQPLLFFVPLLIALRANPTQKRLRVYCIVGVSVALLVSIVLPLRTLFAKSLDHSSRPNIPYQSLFKSVAGLAGEPVAVLAENKLVGGNARLAFRHSRIITPDYANHLLEREGILLVLCETPGCTNDFRIWIRKQYGIDLGSFKFNQAEEPYYYMPQRKHALYWTGVGVQGASGIPKAAGMSDEKP